MSNPFELIAEQRSKMGKGASRRLRRLESKVPGILYGGSEKPVPLSIEHRFWLKALENEAFYSHILTIKVDGVEQKAILRDLQRHPYKPRILHFDLQRVSATEKIHMQIPLHFMGEEDAPGVKEAGGVISHLMANVEVSCFPQNLPEFVEVDVSKLGLDESIHLSSLKLPEGVEFATSVEPGGDRDVSIVSIHMPRIEAVVEEEVVAEEAAGEAEPTAQGSEGETQPDSSESKE